MNEFKSFCGTPLLDAMRREWFMSLSEKDKKKYLKKLDRRFKREERIDWLKSLFINK